MSVGKVVEELFPRARVRKVGEVNKVQARDEETEKVQFKREGHKN